MLRYESFTEWLKNQTPSFLLCFCMFEGQFVFRFVFFNRKECSFLLKSCDWLCQCAFTALPGSLSKSTALCTPQFILLLLLSAETLSVNSADRVTGGLRRPQTSSLLSTMLDGSWDPSPFFKPFPKFLYKLVYVYVLFMFICKGWFKTCSKSNNLLLPSV